jgi:glycosyltransferase involved in cell wall biosynthesis
MAKPSLSIVIPTLNEEGFIGDLLHEILTQEPDMNYEIIVSDSGSTDRTEEIVKTIAKEHPGKNIRFIPAPIKGVSVARNNGAAHANADYIAFLDADTRIPPTFLRNAYLEIKRRNLDGAGCYMKPNSERLVDRAVFSFYHHCILNPLQYTKRPGSAGAGIIVKRSIHHAIGGFDLHLPTCEDLDYIKKISEMGKFRMLKTTNIIFNTRRFDEEGRARVWFKYAVWGSCYLLNIKRVKFEYEFGKFGAKSDDLLIRR